MGRWAYRSRQFFVALLGRVSKGEMEEARQVLGPQLYEILARLPGQYRRHAITVYERVRQSNCEDRAVLQAALLHDSGKYDPDTGRYVMLGHRVAIVLLGAMPVGRRLLAGLAQTGARHRRGPLGLLLYPFALHRRHPQAGAALAARHGASERVVRLIAEHEHTNPSDSDLRTLRAADEMS